MTDYYFGGIQKTTRYTESSNFAARWNRNGDKIRLCKNSKEVMAWNPLLLRSLTLSEAMEAAKRCVNQH